MPRLSWPLGLATLLCVAAPWVAARGEGLSPALRQCVAEQDDARRLACYDAEIARLGTLPPPLTAEQKFGARGDVARAQDRTDKAGEPRLEKLDATVTAIVVQPGGELTITLDNGQIWRQIATGESFRLKAGDRVVVKPGSLGSFSMSNPHGRSVKVKRIG
ncbi:MAG: hypothetical protein KF790_10620 [Steroidobacteraceae bacterium]|nr:hypothetical protein [Steroidobacteraceae bacterium]